jgi:hypothetical protein
MRPATAFHGQPGWRTVKYCSSVVEFDTILGRYGSAGMPRAISAVAVAGVVAASLVAGCSSGGSNAEQDRHATAVATPPPILPEVSLPTSVPNDPKIRKNVRQTACKAIPGGWGAEGVAHNPGSSPVTFGIVVYFATTEATVINYTTTKVTVGPGKTEKWQAEKIFPAAARMLCGIPGITTLEN